MSGRIVLGLGNPSLDADGRVMEGALFYFYQNGTTTPGDIYDAADLADPLPNPVQADAAGRIPDVWAEDDAVFEVVWKSAAGVTIRTFPDIVPISAVTGGGSGEPGVYYLADLAGVLEGNAVDVAALNGALATVAADPGLVKLPPATLVMDSKSLVLQPGAPLVGQGMDLTTLDFSSDTTWASSTGMITAEGGGPGTWNPITVGVGKGDTSVTASGDLTGYIAKGHVMIRSTEWALPHINDVLKFTWAASTAIVQGALTWANGNWYICTTAGTTGTTAPTSTTNPVTDGTATLYAIDYANSENQVRWAASTAVTLGAIRVTSDALILICVTAGTTGTTQPAPNESNSVVTVVSDGTAAWRYAGYYNATKGELKPYGVDRVDGTTIYLNEPIEDSYPLTYTGVAFTVEIAPVDLADIALSDLTIKGSGYSLSNLTPVGTGTAVYYTSNQDFDIGLQVKWCILTLTNVRFVDIERLGWHRLCSVVRTINCEYIHAPLHIESQQYGGFAQAAGDVTEINPLCVNSRHLNDGDGSASLADEYRGVPGAILITGSKARGCWQSVVGNHRDSRRLVVSNFDWTVLTAGFKSRCPDYVLDGGIIVGPQYATVAEYIAQDGLVSVYYQGSRGSIDNVRTEGGVYGLRVSNSDGVIDGIWARMDINAPLLYGCRLGAAASDAMQNLYIDVNVANVVSFDNLLVDGPLANSSVTLNYQGGRAGVTSANRKPAITNTDFKVSGQGCSAEAVALYNWVGGTLQSGTLGSESDSVGVRLSDCDNISIERSTVLMGSGFTGQAWKIESTTAQASQRLNMDDQIVIATGAGGTALEVSSNVYYSSFGRMNTNCATVISAGANVTNRYADAPGYVSNETRNFLIEDADRPCLHTSGTAHTWTIPTNASVKLGIGTRIPVANTGSGIVTIARAGGVSLYLAGIDQDVDLAQYGGGTLIKVAADEWIATGEGMS